jgi:hypothetical protein
MKGFGEFEGNLCSTVVQVTRGLTGCKFPAHADLGVECGFELISDVLLRAVVSWEL